MSDVTAVETLSSAALSHSVSRYVTGEGTSVKVFILWNELNEWLTSLIRRQEKKTETETKQLVMNVDMLLIEASQPGDKVMDPVRGDNGRRNCLE